MINQEDFKNTLAITASFSTILQFLTGTLVCQKIVQKRSTGDTSSFPFISGCLSTSLWLRYGFLIQETSLILVNTIGATLFFAYVVTFFLYSIKKSVVIKQFLLCFTILILTLMYSQYEEDKQQAIKHLGLACCLVTIMFFAAPLASLMHVLKVRNAESLPFPIILATFIVSAQWFIYGIILGDKFIQIPNFLGCALSGFQLSLFYMFRKPYNLENI